MFTLMMTVVTGNAVSLYTKIKDTYQNPQHTKVSIKDTETVTALIKNYLKNKFITSAVLIINEKHLTRFVEVPAGLKPAELSSMIKLNAGEYFPVADIDKYNIDYRQIDDKTILLYAITKDKIEGYLTIFKNLRVGISQIELLPNFLANKIGELDKSHLMITIPIKADVYLYVLEAGQLKNIIEWDYTGFENMFFPYLDMAGRPLLKKVYALEGTNNGFIEALAGYQIEIEMIRKEELFDEIKKNEQG